MGMLDKRGLQSTRVTKVFLNTLHWSPDVVDIGLGGGSFVELLILYEFWAGERLRKLCPNTADLDAQFLCRLFHLD